MEQKHNLTSVCVVKMDAVTIKEYDLGVVVAVYSVSGGLMSYLLGLHRYSVGERFDNSLPIFCRNYYAFSSVN